jgi:hypothetical protein
MNWIVWWSEESAEPAMFVARYSYYCMQWLIPRHMPYYHSASTDDMMSCTSNFDKSMDLKCSCLRENNTTKQKEKGTLDNLGGVWCAYNTDCGYHMISVYMCLDTTNFT